MRGFRLKLTALGGRFRPLGILPLIVLPLWSGDGKLRLSVINSHNKPIKQVVLAPRGGGGSTKPTDDTGFTELSFHYESRPYKISILVKMPGDLYFLSPYDQRVPVPPCSITETECFESVMLGRRAKTLAENDLRVLGSIIANGPTLIDQDARGSFRREVLRAIAMQVETSPNELEHQLLDWAAQAKEPQDRAVAALLNGSFLDAERLFGKSLHSLPETELQMAGLYLGLANALLAQGKYGESTTAAANAIALRPTEALAANTLALSLYRKGESSAALAVWESSPAAFTLYNAGVVQLNTREYAAARVSFRSALDAGSESVFGSLAQQRLATIEASYPAATSRELPFLGPPIIAVIVFALLTIASAELWARRRYDVVSYRSLEQYIWLLKRSSAVQQDVDLRYEVESIDDLFTELSDHPRRYRELRDQLNAKLNRFRQRASLPKLEPFRGLDAIAEVMHRKMWPRLLIALAMILLFDLGYVASNRRLFLNGLRTKAISGQVIDSDGRVIADAVVSIVGTEITGPTDSKGHFSFGRNRYDKDGVLVRAEKPGFKPTVAWWTEDDPSNLTLKLLRQ
jgi:hypothetical protein